MPELSPRRLFLAFEFFLRVADPQQKDIKRQEACDIKCDATFVFPFRHADGFIPRYIGDKNLIAEPHVGTASISISKAAGAWDFCFVRYEAIFEIRIVLCVAVLLR